MAEAIRSIGGGMTSGAYNQVFLRKSFLSWERATLAALDLAIA
jgi:hypothetical protein